MAAGHRRSRREAVLDGSEHDARAQAGRDELSRWLCLPCGSGFLQQSAAALLAQPIAVTTNGHHVTMMEQTIEDRCCHHGIPNTVPHSPTARLEVTSMAPRS